MGKTAHDIVTGIRGLGAHSARKIAYERTGVEPGYDPFTGYAFTEDGRVRSRGARTSSGNGAALIKGSTQTILNGANADVAYGSGDVQWNDSGAFWVSGTPTRILIPSAGTYLLTQYISVQAAFVLGSDTTPVFAALIWHHGVTNTTLSRADVYLTNTAVLRHDFAVVWRFGASDYLITHVENTGGGSGTPSALVDTRISIEQLT